MKKYILGLSLFVSLQADLICDYNMEMYKYSMNEVIMSQKLNESKYIIINNLESAYKDCNRFFLSCFKDKSKEDLRIEQCNSLLKYIEQMKNG